MNNQTKKYELTTKRIKYNEHKLYRIRALRDFGDVKKGDLGGWIEAEKNLSHDGDCWVADEAKVFGNAKVYGNAAKVLWYAMVGGYAVVCGSVSGFAFVSGNAKISWNGDVGGYEEIYGGTIGNRRTNKESNNEQH